MDSAFTLGISHPAGFPTYNLLGKAFTLFPLGSIALKVNLFSAAFACLALAVLYWTAIRFLASLYPDEDPSRFIAPACLGAGLLAFAAPFWMHALVAEVYSLHAFFIAAIILLLLTWREKQDARFLYCGALVYGLSAGNHGTMAFLLPAILVLFFSWNRGNTMRHLFATVIFFFIGLSVYTYLPIRSLAEPSMDWGNPETLNGFFYQVTDRKDAATHFSYLGDSLLSQAGGAASSLWNVAVQGFQKMGNIVSNLMTDLNAHLSKAAVLGFLAGGLLCLRKSPALFFFFVIIVAVNATFFVDWRRESFFPSYIVACLFTSAAVYHLLFQSWTFAWGKGKPGKNLSTQKDPPPLFPTPSPAPWRRGMAWGIAAFIPWMGIANFQKVDRSGLYFGETLLKRVSLSLEDRSIFITGMSWFNFYYLQDVLRLRDDVTGIKAWDLLEKDPPSLLTPRRYPGLVLPDPSRHDFNSREQTLDYVRELIRQNGTHRPILVEQNLTLWEQLPLAQDLEPYRNILLRYNAKPVETSVTDGTDPAFAEFRELLTDELKKPGIEKTEWINKVAFYIPSFAMYYHDKQRYADERAALKLMYEFLGQRGADWRFQMIDNLILDGKTRAAHAQWEILRKTYPEIYQTRLAEGLLLRAEGRWDKAIQALDQAGRLRPRAFRPHLEMGLTWQEGGQRGKAAKEIQLARQKVRNLRQLTMIRRQWQQQQKNFEAASRTLRNPRNLTRS